jgi:hypothetical protein
LVLTTQQNGKNGKHSSVSESSNISAVSYMAIQVFEPMYARQFCSVPSATAIFQAHQYLLLSSFHFLTLLDYNLKDSSQQQGSILELSLADFAPCKIPTSSIQAVKKRGRNSDDDGED